jgi:hypothetical protein
LALIKALSSVFPIFTCSADEKQINLRFLGNECNVTKPTEKLSRDHNQLPSYLEKKNVLICMNEIKPVVLIVVGAIKKISPGITKTTHK